MRKWSGILARPRMATVVLVAAATVPAEPAGAQEFAPQDTTGTAKTGSEFLIPMGSLFLPGLGQFIYGDRSSGFAYGASAVAGYGLYSKSGTLFDSGDLPRDTDEQVGTSGLFLASGASYLSAYDAFGRGVRDHQREGEYAFLTDRAEVSDLFTAPFDPGFLGRWTTWANLAYTGVITGIVLSDRERDASYEPFRGRDVGFAAALSLSAGIGEEAAFRGWLFPLFHETFGERFWLSNGLQSLLFAAGHIGGARKFSGVIGAWAFYEGWLTRRNGWSVRESIFHHFWYDMAVVIATLVTDERPRVALTFPTIRF
ncbi:MAG: CPBP family intramembrane metalloprotease [Gemmatimonadetes bacterium]|nr:CPBP family intramembrane metalloprotease [Gemmatimonadota bacterium]NIR78006.1 CPBP family intramembrane metalloprotease [Gemmatimonadota bacterium]NIT86541.1 CPBP family intramembrane metalloprotease [Gemmatimonadota bacterium]NIU30403.1 CPBP family intramembrane metalloprotease [Gemmatimonadota bacterium]NIU35278.1 CPBP family intramembrane metalloprotease [Gemmatimonadota bacterium]